MLRIDPAPADDAPTLTKADTASAAAPAPRDAQQPFRDPATREDPDWRPGLLPRDSQGRPVATAPRPTPAADDTPPAAPDEHITPSGATADPTAHAAYAPRPRRAFDPMSLVAGIFFMSIAVTYLLDAGNAVDARPGIMLALAVIGVGASGFLGTLHALLTRPRRPTKTPPTTD